MERHYRQLTLEERCSIARLHEDGQSIRKIAAALDRPPSTVSRELNRNRGAHLDCLPGQAQERTRARRWTGARLERDGALRELVIEKLSLGWSPEQVAGWLKLQPRAQTVSHESIYRFIDRQIRRTKDYGWRLLLPRQKSKRGWRGRRGGSSALRIKDRVSIDQRPASADDRAVAGHWEADLMLFSQYGQAALALHERQTRFLFLTRQPSKAAEPVADQLAAWLGSMPEPLRRTITFDNGTEFAFHHQIRDKLGVETYFCDTHSPWQKGGVENAIGRMRRWMPRKTDLATLDPTLLAAYAQAYNNTPRKCLGFKTPAELFSKLSHPLNFKCESTSPLARG
jgi:transposase, IS30 family